MLGLAPVTIDPIRNESIAHEAARAHLAVEVAKEDACAILAAYVDRWNLARRCVWIHRDGGTVHMDERSLRVDDVDVWRCWWDVDGYALTLRAEWLVAPWEVGPQALGYVRRPQRRVEGE